MGNEIDEDKESSGELHRRETREHSKNYTDQLLMGSDKGPNSIGLIDTSISATIDVQNNPKELEKRKEKERFHRLLHMLEERIKWLDDEIERLDQEIAEIEQGIDDLEAAHEADRNGTATPEQKKLLEPFRDENGKLDDDAIDEEVEARATKASELKSKRDGYEGERDKLNKLTEEGSPERESLKQLCESEGFANLSEEEQIEAAKSNLGSQIDIQASQQISEGDADLESLYLDILEETDSSRSSHANEVASTSIKAEAISKTFNATASPEIAGMDRQNQNGLEVARTAIKLPEPIV